ncbi:MAG TPA: diguanylate cyclase, partial [Gammaproteobacteria bacterium]|nr:diguanylate cyclase [Gammaproteobacteria bacterium]
TSQIIAAVAKTLAKFLRQEETIAHLGTGRFAVLLPMTSAFKTNIVAMRFQRTVTNLAFKTGNVIIRVKLAAGLNSTESYDARVDFADLFADTETALSLSIQSSSLKIVRYDEAHHHDNASMKPVTISNVPTAEISAEKKANVVEKRLNASDFKRYISAIFNGHFDQIPEQDLLAMVSPLEAFLEYADKKAALKKA